MLSLRSLKFSGIGRFVEEQTVDFASMANLVQVDGQNNNTGGSSGAGKSTVFNALDFLLGLNDLPNTTLQSRITKEGISVTGEFLWDNKGLTIKRTKKGLSVTVEGEATIEGSSKLAEEKLDEVISMPRHLFRQILHKRQKEGGFFLNLTPGKIHEFLTDALGLEGERKKIKLLEDKAKLAEDAAKSNEAQLMAKNAANQAIANAMEGLGEEPKQEVSRETVLSLKGLAEAAEANLQQLQAKQVDEMSALTSEKPAVTIASFDRSEIVRLEQKQKELSLKANELSVVEQKRQSSVAQELNELKISKLKLETGIAKAGRSHQEAVQVAIEVKRLREHKCPTCEQEWATDAAKAKESALMERIKVLRESVVAGKEAEALVQTTVEQIANLEPQLKPAKIDGLEMLLLDQSVILAELDKERQKERAHHGSETVKARAVQQEWDQKRDLLMNLHGAEAQRARSQYDITRRAFEDSVSKMRFVEEARKRYASQKSKLDADLSLNNEHLSQLNFVKSGIVSELSTIEEVKKLIKSYISCSFEDSLEYISEAATKLIRSIPNMANATVQLEGIKETKDGKIKEEVNAIVHLDGEESIPLKSLSGGERSAVDLGIDLAVIDMIESKTNKGIDVFVLDEPFTGLDTICVENALELLRNSNLSKKVIIVDHNPEAKEMIQSKVLVVRDGQTSIIVQS